MDFNMQSFVKIAQMWVHTHKCVKQYLYTTISFGCLYIVHTDAIRRSID